MKKIHKIKNQISVAVEKGDLDIAWEATFPNAGLRIVSDKLVAKLGGRYSTIDKIKRHHFKKLCSVTITESVFELVKEDNLNKDQYLIGVFHNSIPTQTVKSIILKEFTFPAIEGNKNLEFIKKFKTKMRLQYI